MATESQNVSFNLGLLRQLNSDLAEMREMLESLDLSDDALHAQYVVGVLSTLINSWEDVLTSIEKKKVEEAHEQD